MAGSTEDGSEGPQRDGAAIDGQHDEEFEVEVDRRHEAMPLVDGTAGPRVSLSSQGLLELCSGDLHRHVVGNGSACGDEVVEGNLLELLGDEFIGSIVKIERFVVQPISDEVN